jgi:hypothetical protein
MNNILLILIGIVIIYLFYRNYNNKTETFIEDREDGSTYINPSVKNKSVVISADNKIELNATGQTSINSNKTHLYNNTTDICTKNGNCSHFPAGDGNTHIRPGKKGHSIVLDNANHINLTANMINLNKPGGMSSHIPHENGNTYVRPGKPGQQINIDNAGAINLGSIHGMVSHLPHENGHSYIRPGKSGHSIILDKANHINFSANAVNFTPPGGNHSNIPHENGHTYIRPGKKGHHIYLDNAAGIHHGSIHGLYSHIPHQNNHSYIRPGKKNHNIYIDHANEIRLGANRLCLGNTCINENHFKKLADPNQLARSNFINIWNTPWAHTGPHKQRILNWTAPYDCEIAVVNPAMVNVDRIGYSRGKRYSHSYNHHTLLNIKINNFLVQHYSRWFKGAVHFTLAKGDVLHINRLANNYNIYNVYAKKLFKW